MTVNIGDKAVTVDKGSFIKWELMKEDYMQISFCYGSVIPMPRGTMVSWEGGFEGVLLEDYTPTYNMARNCYEYNVQAWRDYYLGKDRLVKQAGTGMTIFTIMDKPSEILKVIAASAGWTAHESGISNEPWVTLTFNGTNCMDALTMLVNVWDESGYYEWWFDTSGGVHIGKLTGSGAGIELNEDNVAGVTSMKGEQKRVTRVIGLSGTRNLSPRVGLPAPTLNTEGASVEINGQAHTLYRDSKFVVTPQMFKESARVYPNLGSYGGNGTTIKHTFASFGDTHSDQFAASEAEVNIMDDMTLKMMMKNKVLTLNTKAEPKAGVAPSVPTPQAMLSVKLTVVRKTGNDIGIVDTFVNASAPIARGVSTVKIEMPDAMFIASPDTEYALKMEMTLDKSTDTASLDDWQDIEVTFVNSQLGYKIGSDSAYACDTGLYYYGSRILLNPYFLDVKSEKARYFLAPISNRSMTEIGINRGKIPYSWFFLSSGYDDSQYYMMSEKRLVSDFDNTAQGEHPCEVQVIFDDIFPRLGGILASVGEFKSVGEMDSNGEDTGRTLIYYCFDLPQSLSGVDARDFTEDTLKVGFDNDATLAGKEFDVKIVNTGSNTQLAIIPNEDYGVLLPNSSLFPQAGDSYSLYGLNSAIYDENDAALAAAQAALDKATKDYYDRQMTDTGIYTCSIKPTRAITSAANLTSVSLGEAVSLNFGAVSVSTRVIGMKMYLDLPQAGLEITIGNSTPWKKIDNMQKQLLTNNNRRR